MRLNAKVGGKIKKCDNLCRDMACHVRFSIKA